MITINNVVSNENIFNIEFSELEERVIFFLLLGYSMVDIAILFKLSRSYICKIVENLCLRFNVCGYSSRRLVEYLVSIGMQHYISQKFFIHPSEQMEVHSPDLNLDLDLQSKNIIRLLKLNYSQYEIADQFGCSRSAIAKVIYQKILPKLNFTSALELKYRL